MPYLKTMEKDWSDFLEKFKTVAQKKLVLGQIKSLIKSFIAIEFFNELQNRGYAIDEDELADYQKTNDAAIDNLIKYRELK